MAKENAALLSEKGEWIAIDYFRVICALLIVSIHIPVFISIDGVLSHYFNHVICRVAVPFFFISSGFFVADKLQSNSAYRYVNRIILLYLVYTVLYLPQYLYLTAPEGITGDYVCAWIKKFFFVGSYTQLWYLAALAFAVLFLQLAVHFLKLNDKVIGLLAAVLYVIGVIGNSYREVLLGLDIPLITQYYITFSTMRNGLFFGIPMVAAGYLIRKNSSRIRDIGYFKWMAVFVLCMFLEAAIIYRYFNGGEKDMMLFTMPASICFFLAVCFIRQDKERFAELGRKCRKYSVTVFGLHLFVYFYLDRCFDGLAYYMDQNSVGRYVIVLASTFILSAVIIRLSKCRGFKWLKVLY